MSTISTQLEPQHTTLPLFLRYPSTAFCARKIIRLPRPSHVNRLPNELLSLIFTLAVHEHQDASFSCAHSLASVCQRWRAVALDTGRLWTSILLTFPSNGQLAQLTVSLQRSKRYPLDIHMDFRDPDWSWEGDSEHSHPFTAKCMGAVLALILPETARWRSIELLTDTWSPIHAFLSHTQDIVAPLLETLSLSRCNAYFAAKGQSFEPSELKAPIVLFGGRVLPALRKVSLVGVHIDWKESKLRDLLELELKYHARDVMPTLEEFSNILLSCQGMERMSILGWGPRFNSLPPTTLNVIRLPNLRRFSLGLVDNEYAIDLLSCMAFPELQELALDDISCCLDPIGNMQDFTPILDRFQLTVSEGGFDIPFEKVHTLELHNVRSNPMTIERFLYRFPAVQKMVLSQPGANLLAALHPELNSARLCPTLTELRCRGIGSVERLLDLAMARSRKEQPDEKHLRKLHIDIMNDDGVEDHQWAKIIDISTCVDLTVTNLDAD